MKEVTISFKETFESSREERDFLKAIANAELNQMLIDTLYDSVFRSELKYGEDEKKTEILSEVLEKIREHFNIDY